jgi:arylsulfatase A-like enzyme
MDLWPTFAHIIGAEKPDELLLDGQDISSLLLKGEALAEPRPFLYYSRNGNPEAIRLGKWKLHIDKQIGWNKSELGDFEVSLYDLDLDVSEQNNVVSDHPDIVDQMSKLLLQIDSELE